MIFHCYRVPISNYDPELASAKYDVYRTDLPDLPVGVRLPLYTPMQMSVARSALRWLVGKRLLVAFHVATVAVLVTGYVYIETTTYLPLADHAMTAQVASHVVQKYAEQSSKFTDWGLALLAGIIAISITTKVHSVGRPDLAYAILGPASAFLITSVHAGWQFQRRLANLIAFDDYLSDLQSLAQLLKAQTRLFLIGITIATVFGYIFVTRIVGGKTDPSV